MLTAQSMVFFLAAVAAALVLFYVRLYREEARQAKQITGRQKALLRALRILVALMAVLALAKPALTLVRHEERLPVAPILVDESSSMSFPDARDNPLVQGGTRRTRYDTAQSVVARLQEKLTRTHRVGIYTFSESVKLLRELPHRQRDSDAVLSREELFDFEKAPSPTGEYTNIGDAIQETLREHSGDRISGVVLLTDGRQTGGLDLGQAGEQAAAAKVPIHVVAFGSEYPLRDLRIDEVVADPEISLGDLLRFRVKITNQISAPLAASLTLFEEGKKVNEKPLSLARGENQVTIVTIPETEGEREFRLVLPKYEDEIDVENNEYVLKVKVVKRTLRLLLIAGRPTREYLYLVPALLRDPVVELSVWLQSSDIDYVQQGNRCIERLPRSPEEWGKFDVAILFDPDPNELTTQQVAELENMVRGGGGLIFLAGRNHGLAKMVQVHAVKIRELLPVEVDKSTPLDHFRIHERPFKAERTPEGRGSSMFRLDRDDRENEQVWATFPELHWSHPVERVKPGTTVLLRASGVGNGTANCLMAIRRYCEGAVLYCGIDSLWRWRNPHESYDYDRFWVNLVRHLGEMRLKGTQQQVALSTDRLCYGPGEEVKIRLSILDPALLAQLQGVPMYASVGMPLQKGQEEQMVPLRPDPGGEMFYAGSYRARRTGALAVRVRQSAPGATTEAKPIIDVKHAFQVKLQSLEAKDTSADLEGMKALAARTGGKYFDFRNMSNLDDLVAALPAAPQVLSQEVLVEVWDGKMFLALFLVLIGAEWALRKLWGLL